ncbi:hypothetical protein HPB48_002058 [Haemaphysalis longicornis]|uniref:Bromo domain-containing protein n=1 Tax=Haemaphysalis longicornis TaxID=44386 RepID=A0A9J6FI25_HAELO|nr:hypothetical protein HPB48_002058 [Haemaphysalis longicornis]
MALPKPPATKEKGAAKRKEDSATPPPLEPLRLFRVAAGWAAETRRSEISTRSESHRLLIRISSKRLQHTQQHNSEQKGRLDGQLKYCNSILAELLDNEHAWPFLEPVDAKLPGLRDYYKVIKHPMDMGTVKQRMDNWQYDGHEEFARDMRLIFTNCYKYHPPGHQLVAMATELQGIFELLYAKMPHEPQRKKRKPSPQAGEEEEGDAGSPAAGPRSPPPVGLRPVTPMTGKKSNARSSCSNCKSNSAPPRGWSACWQREVARRIRGRSKKRTERRSKGGPAAAVKPRTTAPPASIPEACAKTTLFAARVKMRITDLVLVSSVLP